MKRFILILGMLTIEFVAFGQIHDTPSNAGNGGYISSGNYGGTGNAAYFPSGIWANGVNSWIYGDVAFGFGSLYDRDNKWRISPAGISWFNGGNVGIGTTNPGAKLSFGQYYINSAAPSSSEQTSHLRLYESGSVYYGLGVSDGALNIAANQSGGTLRFYTNSIERMRIDGNGNVGIGTTNPQNKLEVVGSQKWHLGSDNNLFVQDWQLTDQVGPTINAVNDANSAHVPLSFAASMIYLHTPKVGIGTINTQGFALAVNGGIICEEVKVISDVPNSDYVFKSDYKLLNLPDLESFIKEKNHLPEIPSAEEFKEKGYKVGEMDNLLLKKVEELTLYIIELNKKVENLERELQQKAK